MVFKNKVIKLSSDAYLPKRQTKYSIGYDLYSNIDVSVPSNTIVKVDLGIKIIFYRNKHTGDVFYGQIVGRSGLSARGITVIAGLIDPDYEGALNVVIFNNSKEEYKIKRGDRIAQLILVKYNLYETSLYDENENFIETSNTVRVDGFGSTGK